MNENRCSPVIKVTGEGSRDTVDVLQRRLEEVVQLIEGPIRVETASGAGAEAPDALLFTVSPYDSADFAAEKILDDLADLGWIAFEDGSLTDEEEEQIRERLQGLGYIE